MALSARGWFFITGAMPEPGPARGTAELFSAKSRKTPNKVPELPDITVYLEALESRIFGHVFERALVGGPFLLRTADPPLEATFRQGVTGLRRVGKRIAIGFENDLWLVL